MWHTVNSWTHVHVLLPSPPVCPHSTVVPSGVGAREVSSESGSTERPPSLTQQAHTTESGWVGGVCMCVRNACECGFECGGSGGSSFCKLDFHPLIADMHTECLDACVECMHACSARLYKHMPIYLLMAPGQTPLSVVCAGEMEVVAQSRSEAAVSDRDLLSQPVHCE